MGRRWWPVGAVVVGAAGLALIAPGGRSGRSVLVVGDSIMEQSEAPVGLALQADGWDPLVEGHSGSAIVGERLGIDWGVRLPELVAAKKPDVAVLELGTNDHGEPSSLIAARVDQLMGALRHVPRVIWLDVQTRAYTADAQRVNEVLRQATVRWPNLEVLDMNGHFATRRAWHSDPIHFNGAGQVELGHFVRAAIDAPPSPLGVLGPVV